MGYTHYFSRPRTLAAAPFRLFVKDARSIVAALINNGIKLAGPDGTGEPIIRPSRISLNGQHDCGHAPNPAIVIPWPADDAGGVSDSAQDAIAGEWFAGVRIILADLQWFVRLRDVYDCARIPTRIVAGGRRMVAFLIAAKPLLDHMI